MKNFLPIPLLLCSGLLAAQDPDTSKSTGVYSVAEYFLEKDLAPRCSDRGRPGCTLTSSIDTSLDGIQRYFPGNFPYYLGLSNRKLTFEISTEIGFRSGLEKLNLFGYSSNEIKYYNTRAPYTEIFALFGQKKEQFARLLHTQNINKQWNIAVNMLRHRSEGFYLRQNCTDNNISLSTNHTSKSNRYTMLLNGYISSVKTDENGGIQSDSAYEANLFVNKKLLAVNLMEARTRRGNRGAHMTHTLNFGRRDTARKDSTVRRPILPHTSLSYSFSANENWFVYSDTDTSSGYYENTFFDSAATLDSTHIAEFQHGLDLQTLLFKRIRINLGFDQKNVRLVQYNADSSLALDTSMSDQIIHFEIGNVMREDKLKGFFWKIGKQYILEGENAGDDYVFGELSFIFKKNKRLSLDYSSSSHSIPFIYNYYNSNHFKWKKSFDNITETKINLSFRDAKHKFICNAEMIYIDNYFYIDSVVSPTLSKWGDYIAIYLISLKKNFRLKHLGFNNNITWQYIQAPYSLSGEPTIHLPEFITNHSLYYTGKWFKGATEVQLGFDVTYYSSYYADAYMPALGLYYWQNKKEVGNYPYIDFFFNMKIKRARVFFKTEHVNSGLMGPYYLAPHMPAPDRSFKIGINWMFFD